MLKELFPEEMNSQNNRNDNSISPQTIPQETAFDINQPTSSGSYSIPTIEEVKPQPQTVNFNMPNVTPDINNNTFRTDEYNSNNSNNFNNVNNYAINTNNINNYSTYGIGDYKKHAKSDINWKRLIFAVIVLSLLSGVIPGIMGGISGLFGATSSITSLLTSILSLANMFVVAGLSACILSNYLEVKRHRNEKGLFGSFNKLFPYWVTKFLIGLMVVGFLLIPIIFIVIAAVTSKPVFFILFGIAMLGFFVFCIWISLRYALAGYLVVDGKSPFEALRTSKKLMVGHKFQLFGLELSFIGWYFISSMFMSVLFIVCRLPLSITETASIIGLIPHIFFILIAIFIISLPLNIYYNMSIVEFYEDRINNGLNELTVVSKAKPVLLTLLISLVFTLASAGMILLPIQQQPLPINLGPLQVTENGFSVNQELLNGISGLNSLNTTPNIDLGLDDNNLGNDDSWIDDLDNNDSVNNDVNNNTTSDSSTSSGLGNITYSIPDGYKENNSSDGYISYTNDDFNIVAISMINYDDIDFYKEYYPGGKKLKVAGYDAYKYTTGDEYKIYYCYISINSDKGYEIYADNESDLDYVLNSIKF